MDCLAVEAKRDNALRCLEAEVQFTPSIRTSPSTFTASTIRFCFSLSILEQFKFFAKWFSKHKLNWIFDKDPHKGCHGSLLYLWQIFWLLERPPLRVIYISNEVR